MTAVMLYRIDASRNMRRYYRLDVQPDLFGLWLLVREWGRVGLRAEASGLLYHRPRSLRRAAASAAGKGETGIYGGA